MRGSEGRASRIARVCMRGEVMIWKGYRGRGVLAGEVRRGRTRGERYWGTEGKRRVNLFCLEKVTRSWAILFPNQNCYIKKIT